MTYLNKQKFNIYIQLYKARQYKIISCIKSAIPIKYRNPCTDLPLAPSDEKKWKSLTIIKCYTTRNGKGCTPKQRVVNNITTEAVRVAGIEEL